MIQTKRPVVLTKQSDNTKMEFPSLSRAAKYLRVSYSYLASYLNKDIHYLRRFGCYIYEANVPEKQEKVNKLF